MYMHVLVIGFSLLHFHASVTPSKAKLKPRLEFRLRMVQVMVQHKGNNGNSQMQGFQQLRCALCTTLFGHL